ncbi:MAG: hypothetical protein RLZZ196_1910 [Bacteroidota bacterium]|jgi:hypothetical protein
MAEIILKFQEDELDDARTALDGYKWKGAMWDLDQWLRGEIKYNEKLSAETDRAYQAVRDKIREILNDDNLNIES